MAEDYLKLAERYRREYQESGGGKPYHVHSETAVALTPDAKYWIEENFGTGRKALEEGAQYLLRRHRQGDDTSAAYSQDYKDDFLPEMTLSENIEDRRQDLD